MTATIYTEVAGTTCYLGDMRGVVTELHSERRRVIGAFVRADETGAMFFVSLGRQVGERGAHHEVIGWREITRDQFDRLTDLDTLRNQMGWRDCA